MRRRRRIWQAVLALAVMAATPAFAQDLPLPPSNLELIPAGSLVIPMDNSLQSLAGTPFNLKAYGLVNRLLQNNIPVKWAIRAGKAKDGVDFTATAQRLLPSSVAAASVSFSGGPFIVPEAYASLALAQASTFGGSVAVYRLTQAATVDVRYTLTFKPRVFVNSTNSSIATDVLVEAAVPDYVVSDDFTLLANSCYTVVMEPHNTSTSGVAAVKSFVQSGGNFMAQCASVVNYENNGQFITTLGITNNNISNVLTYPNPDLAWSQFIGALEPNPSGSETDYRLLTGSAFTSGGHVHADNVGASPPTYAAMAGKLYGGPGGMAFFLGGHDYTNGSTLAYYNGRRMMLNAVLSPATRPVACNLSIPVPDLAVSKSHSGGFVQGRTGTYQIAVSNIGTATTVDTIVVVDTLPAGLTYQSSSGTGWTVTAVGQVVTATYPAAVAPGAGAGTPPLSITVAVGKAAIPSVTNRAWVSGGGELNAANNLASDPTTVIPMVTGLVFEDLTGNGVRDPGDPGLPNVQVQITAGLVFSVTVVTDATGVWFATGVPNGTATVDVLESSIGGIGTVVHTAGVDPSTVQVVPDSTVDAGVDGYSGLLADLSVAKSGPATALARDTLRYVIVTSNGGPNAAPAVVVRDTLPAGVQFISASRGGVVAGSVVTWPALDLANGASVTDTVRVLAPANPATLVNLAAASASRADPDPANNNGSAAGSRVSTAVAGKADLALVKTDGRTTVTQLDTLSYTITITNAGPSNVALAPVTDAFPASFTGVSWTCAGSGGGSCGTASGSGNIAGVLVTVPVGGSAVFTARGTATQAGALINSASVAAPAGVTDPVAGNNAGADTTTVVVQPLRFASAANQTFTVGDPTTAISPFTITNATNGSVITALRDLRIGIPATLAMRWDTLDLSAVIAGSAAGKVSSTVRYEDAGRTLVLDVLSDFAPAEQLTVSALGFAGFTAPSLAASLTLEVNNDNVVSVVDDKTKTIASNQAGCTTDPVTTVAQLRSAVANAACNPVNVVPGTYNLASDGLGMLDIARTVTIRNTGGGRVILDAGGASRTTNVKILGGTVTLEGLTILGGQVAGHGGGLACEGATLIIRQTTVSGNTTTGDGRKGAGLYSKDCTTTLTNVTVSGNAHVGKSDGGGIYVDGGTVTLVNTTVANNAAGATKSGGGIYLNNNALVLTNSLVADNTAPISPQIHVQAGTVTSNGYNLVEGGCTGCLPGDLTADPSLGALANNGGDSWTQALLPGSPAIDRALTSSAPAVDQRNIIRPQGAAADIGAYEAAVPAITVTPDGAQLLQRLPSNGVTYSASFVVTNGGVSGGTFGIKAFKRPGSAVTIISVNGVAGDTVAATIPGGSALVVPVVYSVGNVAAGIKDSVYLRARSTVYATVSDTGFADLTVVRPALTMTKAVVAGGPIVPGTDLTYVLTLTNAGTAAANPVTLVDSLPPQVEFKVGSGGATLPAGLTVALSYSNDAGATWTYVPVSAGCGGTAGYDRCVNRVRWTFTGTIAATGPDNTASLQFIARIR